MKHWSKPNRLQWVSFIASIPVIDILHNYIMYKERLFHDVKIWLISFPLILLLGVGSFLGHALIGNYIKLKYPSLRQSKMRILLEVFCVMPFMSFSVAFIFLLYDTLGILGYQLSYDDLKMGILVGFCVNIIFETLFEANYILQKYQESVEEKQNLQNLAVFQEFDTLKNQVNPHFLFNCFNTLSSLISEDKEKAGKFLDELSKVYRYLLQRNNDGMSTLNDEIKFIRSYFQLLLTRHGEAVKLNIETDKKYGQYLLPSLTLQLLVENAVKHNAVSKLKPLVIDIFTPAGNKLVVNNNRQFRSVKAISNKVGLQNIRAKYSLLHQKGFQVIEDEKNFTVVLPLIWNNQSAVHKNNSV